MANFYRSTIDSIIINCARFHTISIFISTPVCSNIWEREASYNSIVPEYGDIKDLES